MDIELKRYLDAAEKGITCDLGIRKENNYQLDFIEWGEEYDLKSYIKSITDKENRIIPIALNNLQVATMPYGEVMILAKLLN